MSRISRLFKVFILIVLIASFTATPALAQSPVKYTSTYQYDSWYDGLHYIGNGSYNWRVIVTNKVSVYDWYGNGNDAIYDNSGTLVWSGSWSYRGTQIIKDGQTSVYHYADRGRYNDNHSYRYTIAIVNGALKMNHYWFDGVKMY